ncbi:MAG: CBS domain-containing protein [Candidatus Helarchaeota archaeon]|nr:CBS domain-containing protein [Candidatus Helarchaeota archaeon]
MNLTDIKAKEIMVSKLITSAPDEKVGSTDILMVRRGIGCLLITSGEKLVGILTNRDIVRLKNSTDTIHKTVAQIMTKNPMTITSDTNLKEIIKIMVTHSIEHLPVVENGKLVGLIGHNQIFRSLIKVL